MRVFLTGATGLIGRHVADALLDRGDDVVALARAGSSIEHLTAAGATVVEGDVLDGASVATAVEGCDAAIHLAGLFSYGAPAGTDLAALHVDGTRNVLHGCAAAGVARVVVTSSSVVFGSSRHPTVRDESSSWEEDESPAYYVAKRHQHVDALAMADRSGLQLVLACPTVTLGGPDRRLVPSNGLVASYLRDPWKATWDGGVNLVDVRDVAAGHVILLDRGRAGVAYILGGQNWTWRQVHATIAELSGVAYPAVTTNRTGAYVAGCWHEALGKLSDRAPLVTREQADTIGRYYWYSSERAHELGYVARSAHEAVVHSLAWLTRSPDLARSVRAALRLHPDVRALQARLVEQERGR